MSAVSREIKLVVVGDDVDEGPGSNKTILLFTYVDKEYPKGYVPSAFQNYRVNLTVDEDTIGLCLWDTKGQEDYDRLRPLSYPETDVFLMVFSVVNRESYDNVRDRWIGELRHYCPSASIILVGCHTEKREELEKQGLPFITPEEGEQLANEINAVKYLECSARTGENVEQVFDEAAKAVLGLFPTPMPKSPSMIDQIFSWFYTKDDKEKEAEYSIATLIEELRAYAKDRAAEGEGFRRPWGDLVGGKPGAVKVNAATDLADDLEANGIDLQKEYSQDALEALLGDTLGEKVKKYPDLFSRLKRILQAETVAESEGNLQLGSGRRLSH